MISELEKLLPAYYEKMAEEMMKPPPWEFVFTLKRKPRWLPYWIWGRLVSWLMDEKFVWRAGLRTLTFAKYAPLSELGNDLPKS